MKQPMPGWPDIRSRSGRLRRDAEKLLNEVEALTKGPDPITADLVLSAELAAWRGIMERAGELLAASADQARQAAATALDTFTSNLKDALTGAGFTVYGDGNLLILDGIVYISADTRRGIVHVNTEELPSFEIHQVLTAAKREAEHLKPNITSPADLLPQLRTCYKLQCHVEGKEPGTQIQTLALLPHMAFLRQRPSFRNNPTKEQYQGYPLDLFRADLYTLLQGEQPGLKYASGSDTKGAVFMLVPALGRTAHVGRIWFEGIV